jgi:hypothetical protein
MFYRARYLHVETEYARDYNGFSVLLEPISLSDPKDVHNVGSVKVRVTFCSKDDHFSRKAARAALANKSAFHIPVRNLPAKLQEFDDMCSGWVKNRWDDVPHLKGNAYAWIWKYFL